MGDRPSALPFGLEREEMARATGWVTPTDLDGTGARSEDTELGRAAADERAEITRWLEHIERIGGENVAELKEVRSRENHPHRGG